MFLILERLSSSPLGAATLHQSKNNKIGICDLWNARGYFEENLTTLGLWNKHIKILTKKDSMDWQIEDIRVFPWNL